MNGRNNVVFLLSANKGLLKAENAILKTYDPKMIFQMMPPIFFEYFRFEMVFACAGEMVDLGSFYLYCCMLKSLCRACMVKQLIECC